MPEPDPSRRADVRRILDDLLDAEIPERDRLLELAPLHLDAILGAGLNLTRITGNEEYCVRHVVDSLLILPLLAGAKSVVDLGSGAGFPGVPLAIALPKVKFVLAESVGKKAAFLRKLAEELSLTNVRIAPERAEAELRKTAADVVVIRAVSATEKLVRLLGPVRRQFGTALLFKGPAGPAELEAATKELERARLAAQIVLRTELPRGQGSRTILKLQRLRERE